MKDNTAIRQEDQGIRKGRSTAKDLMGLPVISLSDGERKGEVHDVVYDPAQGRLVGFFVHRGGGFFSSGENFWLPDESIHAIGEDAVTIDSPEALSAAKGSHPERSVEGGEVVLGKRLMTEGGKFLGNIDDVLIDRASRRVVAYDVSGGLWHDMMRGQTAVPIPQVFTIGKDVVVVPDTVQADVEAPTGGLLAATETAREKITSTYETAAHKASLARAEVAGAVEEKEADYARGKTAGSAVTDDAGNVIVREGEVITDAHIRRATETGQMHALALAAGRARVSEVAENVRERTAELSEAAQERQGAMLIGKTTGRAVLSDNGVILVPANHVVTETDVTAVRASGKLNDLTAAVGAGAWDAAKERLRTDYAGASEQTAVEVTTETEPPVVVEQPETVVVQTSPTDREAARLRDAAADEEALTPAPPSVTDTRTGSR